VEEPEVEDRLNEKIETKKRWRIEEILGLDSLPMCRPNSILIIFWFLFFVQRELSVDREKKRKGEKSEERKFV